MVQSLSMETSSKVMLWLLLLSIVAVIFSTVQQFLVQKNYNFTLEAECDMAERSCFVRDCSSGECPPNELETYRIFEVTASDFNSCSQSDCLDECMSGVIQCIEVKCDSDAGDICTEEPPPPDTTVDFYWEETSLLDEADVSQNSTSTNEHDKKTENFATSTSETDPQE